MRKKIVIIIAVVFLGLGSWIGQKYYGRTDEDRAVATLKEYLKTQENEKYDLCYAFLSSKHKQELQKDYNVSNPGEYKKFRYTSETTWYNAKILEVKRLSKTNIHIIVNITYDGEGYVDTIKNVYFMVKENNKWKIDDWEY